MDEFFLISGVVAWAIVLLVLLGAFLVDVVLG